MSIEQDYWPKWRWAAMHVGAAAIQSGWVWQGEQADDWHLLHQELETGK